MVAWPVAGTLVDPRSKDAMRNCVFGECEKNLVEEPVFRLTLYFDAGNYEFEAKGKPMHWNTHEINRSAVVLFA